MFGQERSTAELAVILPYKPRMVFLRAGGNDLNAGKTPEQVFAGFKKFGAKIQSKLPETEIAFISLSPSIARWKQADKEKAVNTMIEEYVRKTPRLKYIETYPEPLVPDGRQLPELYVADKLLFNAQDY